MSQAHVNLSIEALVEHALRRKEGELSANGALTTVTGKRTGRSPKDRYIVKDAITENSVDWGEVNQPVDVSYFESLWARAEKKLAELPKHFVSDLQVGADERYALSVKVTTENAWHNLFTRHLFIRPDNGFQAPKERQWQLLNVVSLTTDPKIDGCSGDGTVMINFTDRKVLLCGMRYAGEMKKSLFSVLNFWVTDQDVLPMHCAANMGKKGDTALFFGLSGTGKTTLSSDPERLLIGDDEHGWSKEGVFNFEGGCYAKCIDLSKEREPVIWGAIRDGAIMENVVLDKNTKMPDFTDAGFTQNTRAAYPRDHIELRVDENRGGHPNAVIFLTCDLFGVLPPVALLNQEQAAYYFLSGYTALVGSTEMGGGAGIRSTFSTCFGAPFFPRPAQTYANLLIKRVNETGAQVYLVNTGWTGGSFGQGGERFSIPTTRAVIRAILSGDAKKASKERIPGFGLEVPTELPGVDINQLFPERAWANKAAFGSETRELMTLFTQNFQRFDVSENIKNAGPNLKEVNR